jgi:hypothetical protein
MSPAGLRPEKDCADHVEKECKLQPRAIAREGVPQLKTGSLKIISMEEKEKFVMDPR